MTGRKPDLLVVQPTRAKVGGRLPGCIGVQHPINVKQQKRPGEVDGRKHVDSLSAQSSNKRSKIGIFLYADKKPAFALLNADSLQKLRLKMQRNMLCLPGMFFGNFGPDISGVCCCNRFQRIVGAADRMLWDVRSCHRLSGGTCSITGRASLRCGTGGRMRPKRGGAYFGHPKHTSANPCPAGFNSVARPVVFGVNLLEQPKHSFGAVCSPGCQQPLVLLRISLHHCPLSYQLFL